jgi:hypothetical protein
MAFCSSAVTGKTRNEKGTFLRSLSMTPVREGSSAPTQKWRSGGSATAHILWQGGMWGDGVLLSFVFDFLINAILMISGADTDKWGSHPEVLHTHVIDSGE